LEWLPSRTQIIINVGKDAVKQEHFHTVGGKLVQPLWEAVGRFLKKLNKELPYDPATLLLGIYPKECKAGYNTDTLHTNVYYSTVRNSQATETAQMPHY
jgi:hypothetical protein